MHLIRLLALIALAVSVALLVNHVYPNARFCAYGSGCDEVQSSAFGHPLGVPLPVVGVVAFGAIFGLSLFPAGPSLRLLRWLSWGAGAGGLALLLIQVVLLRLLCRYCAVVDLSAVAMAVLQLVWGGRAGPIPEARGRPLWLAAALAALGLGAAGGALGSRADADNGPPPPEVTALWVPGKINVVEVADFDCRHCRRMHAVLRQFLAEQGDRVHFVRLTAPMPVHPQARAASRAFVCAREQGKGDEMAEALFRASDLSPEGCERLAAALGLSVPAFHACTAAPATDAHIDGDVAWVKVVGRGALPLVWVQDRMILGVQPIEVLRSAARAAEESDRR